MSFLMDQVDQLPPPYNGKHRSREFGLDVLSSRRRTKYRGRHNAFEPLRSGQRVINLGIARRT